MPKYGSNSALIYRLHHYPLAWVSVITAALISVHSDTALGTLQAFYLKAREVSELKSLSDLSLIQLVTNMFTDPTTEEIDKNLA